MKKVMIKVQEYYDRMEMVKTLANAGYTVKIEIDGKSILSKVYWVVFEVPDINIKD